MQEKNGSIIHLLAPHSGPSLLKWLSEHLAVSIDELRELMNLGALYHQTHRIRQDLPLEKGDYIRVHSHPKRFTLPEKLSLLDETNDYLALLKPSGLPTHPTVDNDQENLLAFAQKFRPTLFVTTRLDVPTSGIVIYAKTKAFQSWFNRQNKIKKYKAQVEGHYQGPDELIHYMKPDPRAPKILSDSAQQGYSFCRLWIHKKVYNKDSTQLDILLDTGRTHQIRAQLSHLGHPVIGDTIYKAQPLKYSHDAYPEKIHLCHYELQCPPLNLKIDQINW